MTDHHHSDLTSADIIPAASLSYDFRHAEGWEWLASLFASAPDADRIADMRRGCLGRLIEDLATDPLLMPGLQAMAADLKSEASDEVLAARLASAWNRLFVGLAGPETVPPYESAFCGDGRLFQAPSTEMARLLASYDVSVAPDFCEPADHLSVELAVMARLVAAGHPDRCAFAKRLMSWTPRFRDVVKMRDRTGFWAAAADVLVAATACEADAAALPDIYKHATTGEWK